MKRPAPYNSGMTHQIASRTWSYERDDRDRAEPYRATLLMNDQPVASARGADELSAAVRLLDVMREQGIPVQGRVLAFSALLRLRDEFKRRTGKS